MEFWKPLRNFPNYEGSTEGRIRCIRTQRVQKPTVASRGQLLVSLYKDGTRHSKIVRRLIADTFIGECPGMDVRHKDGNPLNCRPTNLEYVTRSELIKNAYDRGTKVPVHVCRVRVIETGVEYSSVVECAKDIGCSKSTIYKHLDGVLKSVRGVHIVRV